MAGKGRTSMGGQTLEDVIRSMRLVGFVECSSAELAKANNDMFAEQQRLLVTNMAYTTIFGTKGRREYHIQSPEWTGELECKFQNTGGSVDEKMVYVTETLKRTSLQRLVIVYGGAYWLKQSRGKAIIAWLKTEAAAMQHTYRKELKVLSLDGFITWVNRIWGRN